MNDNQVLGVITEAVPQGLLLQRLWTEDIEGISAGQHMPAEVRLGRSLRQDRLRFQLAEHPVLGVGDMMPERRIDTLRSVEIEKLENKKLLICYWWIADEQSKKKIKQLTKIAGELDTANVTVILLNARPYSKKYASVNIGADKQWLGENNVPFLEADIPAMEDIMEVRRATGARFLPHMILTDENKIIRHEGFDVRWIQENVL